MHIRSVAAATLAAFTFVFLAPMSAHADEAAILKRLVEMEERIEKLERRLHMKDHEIAERDKMIRALREDLDETRDEMADAGGMGGAPAWTRDVEIGGMIELEATYVDPKEGDSQTDATVEDAELWVSTRFNDWLTGEMVLEYRGRNDKDIEFEKGYLTIAPPDSTWSADLGYLYPPFGRFRTHMIPDTLTQDLGEAQETSIVVKNQMDNVYLGAFVYNGSLQEDGDDRLDNLGAMIGFEAASGGATYGLDFTYISDFGESAIPADSVRKNLVGAIAEPDEDANGDPITVYKDAVYTDAPSGMSASGFWHMGNFTLFAEYITATDSFDVRSLEDIRTVVTDDQGMVMMLGDARGAEPSAWMIEAGYDFMLGARPANIAFGYSGTEEALAMGLEESRLVVGLDIHLADGVEFNAEWMRKDDYDRGEYAGSGCTRDSDNMKVEARELDGGRTANCVIATGESEDTITFRLRSEF